MGSRPEIGGFKLLKQGPFVLLRGWLGAKTCAWEPVSQAGECHLCNSSLSLAAL